MSKRVVVIYIAFILLETLIVNIFYIVIYSMEWISLKIGCVFSPILFRGNEMKITERLSVDSATLPELQV